MAEQNQNNFFTGLVLGAIVGAGLYYFLTSTEEGKRVKTQFQEKSKETLDDLGELMAEIEEKGEEFKEKAKLVQLQFEEKVKGAQTQVATEVKEKLAHIKELRQRGRQAVQFFTHNGKPLS